MYVTLYLYANVFYYFDMYNNLCFTVWIAGRVSLNFFGIPRIELLDELPCSNLFRVIIVSNHFHVTRKMNIERGKILVHLWVAFSLLSKMFTNNKKWAAHWKWQRSVPIVSWIRSMKIFNRIDPVNSSLWETSTLILGPLLILQVLQHFLCIFGS